MRRKMMDLVYRNEKNLFTIAAIISILFWLVLIVSTFGIALVYILFAFIIYLFAQSGFISHIKGNGVKVTEAQYPDLHHSLTGCCQKIGLDTVPEMYLLRTDFFNALATKFLGRNFIVLFTDVVDALSDEPAAINFYVGHEIGHIHRGHLKWMAFLFPALLLPVLGTAYRRAQEYTCDHYGAQCCDTEVHVCAALAAISAGDTRWKELNTAEYLEQIPATSGFWMSFHELTSDYPWLTKRMANALAFRRNEEIRHPRRSFLAGFLSVFVPRFGAGGGVSLLLTVAMIAILVALALPAYQDYTVRAQIESALSDASRIQTAIDEYTLKNETWPTSLIALGFEYETIPTTDGNYNIGVYDDGMIGIALGADGAGEERYVVLEPNVEDGVVNWVCYGQNMAAGHLPVACRP
jgi:Zn-dependent protease with chaperone function/type II secretory pathway pseudopilin PulG